MPPAIAGTAEAGEGPPPGVRGPVAWLRRNLFSNVFDTTLTLLLGAALLAVVPKLFAWAFLDSVWTAGDPAQCRDIAGACWAVIAEKHRVILFGTYRYDQQWRGVAVIALVVVLSGASMVRRLWPWPMAAAWLVAFPTVIVLMRGGVLGLVPVPTTEWGGLPLTIILFLGSVVGGLPLAVLLALGRRSKMPVIRALCVGFIEITRGVPLLTVLFMASMMMPLFLPASWTVDQVLRATLGMALFFAAYAAEIVRGGLQAIPRGQFEAAGSLGLGYWRTTLLIVLPQALRIVLPPLVSDIIRAFKNTSVVLILGLFDLLGATSAALSDPLWTNYYAEAYLVVAAIYFAFCYAMSRYGQSLERRLNARRNF
ncbi:MAG: amino acid ABC transporter permease [Alphaproteobacteria bacterium]|nr:amino acid ABC transporter permease [Alphaproteobacteria bacterium]